MCSTPVSPRHRFGSHNAALKFIERNHGEDIQVLEQSVDGKLVANNTKWSGHVISVIKYTSGGEDKLLHVKQSWNITPSKGELNGQRFVNMMLSIAKVQKQSIEQGKLTPQKIDFLESRNCLEAKYKQEGREESSLIDISKKGKGLEGIRFEPFKITGKTYDQFKKEMEIAHPGLRPGEVHKTISRFKAVNWIGQKMGLDKAKKGYWQGQVTTLMLAQGITSKQVTKQKKKKIKKDEKKEIEKDEIKKEKVKKEEVRAKTKKQKSKKVEVNEKEEIKPKRKKKYRKKRKKGELLKKKKVNEKVEIDFKKFEEQDKSDDSFGYYDNTKRNTEEKKLQKINLSSSDSSDGMSDGINLFDKSSSEDDLKEIKWDSEDDLEEMLSNLKPEDLESGANVNKDLESTDDEKH